MLNHKRKTITAIIKCHNEELFLRECILSIRPFVDDILFIDNNNNDSSLQIAKDLNVRVEVFKKFPGGNITLADYYNWCTLQTETDYILKWDADMVAYDYFGKVLQYLDGNTEAVFYSLYNITGDHKHVLSFNNGLCGPEPYIFRRDFEHYSHLDGIERLPFWNDKIKYKIIYFDKPLGLHMNIKSDLKYYLREAMKEYRRLDGQINVCLEEWVKKDNFRIDAVVQSLIKNLSPFKGEYPDILAEYILDPKWVVEYLDGRPNNRRQLR